MMRIRHATICCVPIALTAALCGCLKVRTHILVNLDGTATVTERVELSRGLLDLGSEAGGALGIAGRLTRKAADERIKQMGKGVRLISHKVNDLETNAREAVTVFHVADLNAFRYASPFAAFADYPENSTLKCKFFPLYGGTWWGRKAGQMAVLFTPVKRPPNPPRKDDPKPKGPSPAQVQILRALQPVFQDMLDGFRIRLTVESYAPVRRRGGWRGSRAGVKTVDVVDFASDDLDRFGGEFLANEEIMLELLRGRLGGENILGSVKEQASNQTVPVYHAYGANEIWFYPSRPLFEKHFKGKMLTFYFDRTPRKTRPATFEEIGYKGKTAKPGSKRK